MNTNQSTSDYMKLLKNLERRLKTVEKRQKEVDEKLDHIIFRLVVDETKPAHTNTNGDCRYDRNGYHQFRDI